MLFLADYMSKCVCTLVNRVRQERILSMNIACNSCHWCKIISFPWRISSRLHFMIIRVCRKDLLLNTRITLGGSKKFGMLLMLMLFTIYMYYSWEACNVKIFQFLLISFHSKGYSIRFACFCADMWARDFKGNSIFLHTIQRCVVFFYSDSFFHSTSSSW